jgi:putative flavoprotein involved in K+ transport
MPAYYPLLRFYDRLSANHRGNSDHEMQGGRTEELITTGVVSVRPGIRLLRDESVEFVDGQRDPFDAVIYATGYRPALNHMREVVNELVRRRRGGLHFLGLDNLRNVRSRFLVGIREDAALLAQRLDV